MRRQTGQSSELQSLLPPLYCTNVYNAALICFTCSLHSAQYSVHNSRCTLYISQWTLHCAQCSVLLWAAPGLGLQKVCLYKIVHNEFSSKILSDIWAGSRGTVHRGRLCCTALHCCTALFNTALYSIMHCTALLTMHYKRNFLDLTI